MNLALVVLTPFVGALLAAWVTRFGRLQSAVVAGVVTAVSIAWLIPLASYPFSGETVVWSVPWIPGAGLEFSFRLDGLGLLFALLILGIGFLVVLYARYYLREGDSMGRFYAYLLAFMGSMLGIVLSENVIQLLVFWELTSLTSYLLISYWQHRRDAREGALMALAITGAGGLALLGGLLLLGHIVGSYALTDILAAGDTVRAHPLYLPTLVLVLLGALTKSAQFPFHFWLPHAMAAPTPVSAYLHSATMVKAGVFLLARLFPTLSGTPEWTWIVAGAGLATLLIGAAVALFKHDLKGLLAYSTVSHLGLITTLFGLGTPLAAVAGVFHIINHATFKASLFMAAGIIDHEAGTRDMRRLNGLWSYMPYTATLAMVAAAAMAGVPLLNGFLSKELFFAETVHLSADRTGLPWLPIVATLSGVFAVAYSLRFIHDVFFNGEPVDLPRTPHEPPRWMRVPVEALVALCLLVGVLPALTVGPILAVAAQATLQGPLPYYSLTVWHGFNPALLMSVIALGGGAIFYLLRHPLFRIHDRHEGLLDARKAYRALFDGAWWLARRVTRLADVGSLQRLVGLLVLTTLAAGAAGALTGTGPLTGTREGLPLDGVSLVAGLAMAVGAIGTVVLYRRRFVAIIVIGVVGLVEALAFIKFSAPDLALTQLSVEIVTIVLLLLALYFLPWNEPRERFSPRLLGHGVLAVAAGLGAGLLTWAVLTRPYETIAGYFLEHSKPGGGGTNVVNVILVDFRGYDTLGEIVVLALAGLGIFALVDGLRLAAPGRDEHGHAWSWDRHPVIMASLIRLLLPLALLVALFILLRGHNLPGGGFIAGLVTAVALIMQYLANGLAWTRERMPWKLRPVIAAGLTAAVGTGLGAWAFGYPFLSHTFTYVKLPIFGKVELATALAFDVGVYLVVVGVTLLILVNLGRLHGTIPPAPATADRIKEPPWKP